MPPVPAEGLSFSLPPSLSLSLSLALPLSEMALILAVAEGVPPPTDAVLAARFARFDTNQDGVLGALLRSTSLSILELIAQSLF